MDFSNGYFRWIKINNNRLELWSHRIYISKTSTFNRVSRGLRSCFILTCVCDLLPCTTEEFHLPMDAVADNEFHCSQMSRLTFYLIWLVSEALAMQKFLVRKIYSQLFCGYINIVNAMFVDMHLQV